MSVAAPAAAAPVVLGAVVVDVVAAAAAAAPVVIGGVVVDVVAAAAAAAPVVLGAVVVDVVAAAAAAAPVVIGGVVVDVVAAAAAAAPVVLGAVVVDVDFFLFETTCNAFLAFLKSFTTSSKRCNRVSPPVGFFLRLRLVGCLSGLWSVMRTLKLSCGVVLRLSGS